ncbi:isoprenoid synthase domain-containing protein, partial [Mycena olivaceomarginata]
LDDIEDNSQLRRAAHTVYGIPRTINAATYVHTMVYQELSHMKSPHSEYSDLVMILTGTMESSCTVAELDCLHHGQGLSKTVKFFELPFWNLSDGCTETGGLLRMGVRLMMACTTTNRDMDYVALVDLIGVHYQIRDDYMNLQSPDYSANKGFTEDIKEGKFSFLIIHGCMGTWAEKSVFSLRADVLKTRPATLTLKTQVIGYLEHQTKSFDYTVAVLDALEVEINKKILNFEGNAELSEIVKGL